MTYWTRIARNGGRLVLIHENKRVGSVSAQNSGMWAARVKGKILKLYPTCSGAKMRVERELGTQSNWFKETLARIESSPRIKWVDWISSTL